MEMDEAHRRQRTIKARRSGAESKSSEPEEQQVLISASVAEFIDGLQENVQNAASDRIKALGDPANIRESTEIRGRPGTIRCSGLKLGITGYFRRGLVGRFMW